MQQMVIAKFEHENGMEGGGFYYSREVLRYGFAS